MTAEICASFRLSQVKFCTVRPVMARVRTPRPITLLRFPHQRPSARPVPSMPSRYPAMRPVALVALSFALAAAVPVHAQSAAPPAGIPPAVYRVLQDIKAADKGQLAVSEEDGRFLRLMVASSRATRALEIGGASGYSAIWIGLGLRETGGKLVTIEFDPARAKAAEANIRRAGLSDVVTVVPGDAFQQIPKIG